MILIIKRVLIIICLSYNLTSAMNKHSKSKDKMFPICELTLKSEI